MQSDSAIGSALLASNKQILAELQELKDLKALVQPLTGLGDLKDLKVLLQSLTGLHQIVQSLAGELAELREWKKQVEQDLAASRPQTVGPPTSQTPPIF